MEGETIILKKDDIYQSPHAETHVDGTVVYGEAEHWDKLADRRQQDVSLESEEM